MNIQGKERKQSLKKLKRRLKIFHKPSIKVEDISTALASMYCRYKKDD